MPGEIELGEQFGVSRTAVREAVEKTLTAEGMVLPRPRIGTRVTPQSNWNFLDQELLTWWMTRELSSGHRSLSGYAYLFWSRKLAYWLQRLAPPEQKAHLNTLMADRQH
ncbi:FadR/GntR family transcriptional regulator [Escherichia coli]